MHVTDIQHMRFNKMIAVAIYESKMSKKQFVRELITAVRRQQWGICKQFNLENKAQSLQQYFV